MNCIRAACFPLALLAAQAPSWKDKRAAEWTEADARQILTDSPWAKQTSPKFNKQAGGTRAGMGGIGIGRGGIGIGGPRMGGRGGGMGRHGGEQGGGGQEGERKREAPPATLTVRWESALPVQAAELKSRDTGAPEVDEGHYAIEVLGVPARMLEGDPKSHESRLKGQAELKREGKKPIKPTEVRVLPRDEGLLILYLFSRSEEFTKDDRVVVFGAHIGPLEISQPFELTEMVFEGKIEL